MARQAPAGLLGIHLNLPATVPPEVAAALAGGGPAPAGLSDKERAVFESLMTYAKKGNSAYFVMMTARPQTIGYGLTDSPAGLAAWMLVHPGFALWTYGGDPEKSPTKDEVLDDITLYWLTNSATSSARLYWENGGRGSVINAAAQKTAEISLPVAITVFRSLSFRDMDPTGLSQPDLFHEVDKGGHFAAHRKRGVLPPHRRRRPPRVRRKGRAGRPLDATPASPGYVARKILRKLPVPDCTCCRCDPELVQLTGAA
jgi:hypothetical protein